MIHFERSFDYELVRHILTHPKIYPYISDDGSPPASEYRPIQSETVWYIVVRRIYPDAGPEEILGLWMLHPHNSVCWEIHTCLLPNAWGNRALIAGWLLPEWIWAHTPCRRIITNVPTYNRVALNYAKRVGMQQYGLNPQSYLKGGKLHDQICLGISPQSRSVTPGSIQKEEEVCQPQPQLSRP